ncbi:hypothetical protein [Neptuniibacter sp. QD37_11]|uniref:hypothetical protein n=1 Tax=Neptuniibacter sp. QD37_11 TaxID=3398209 RepID=UPI0039F509B8
MNGWKKAISATVLATAFLTTGCTSITYDTAFKVKQEVRLPVYYNLSSAFLVMKEQETLPFMTFLGNKSIMFVSRPLGFSTPDHLSGTEQVYLSLGGGAFFVSDNVDQFKDGTFHDLRNGPLVSEDGCFEAKLEFIDQIVIRDICEAQS